MKIGKYQIIPWIILNARFIKAAVPGRIFEISFQCNFLFGKKYWPREKQAIFKSWHFGFIEVRKFVVLRKEDWDEAQNKNR